MSRFTPLQVNELNKVRRSRSFIEQWPWKRFETPVYLKELGPSDYVDFSLQTNSLAVTSSTKVQIYDPNTKNVTKTFSHFKQAAFGANFRSDGLLLIVGGEDCLVRLFDVEKKCLLRRLRKHKRPVHRCFFTVDKMKAASFSDDKTLLLWDIATGVSTSSFESHTDYIRAGCTSSRSSDIIFSGSYDHSVKTWDCRTPVKPIVEVNHGFPVESVLMFPFGNMFLSAGGPDICVWDAAYPNKPLTRISSHRKTVTCLRLADDNKYFLSGSLDHHVKVYDTTQFQPIQTITYQSSILSLAVSPSDKFLAVGTVDCTVALSRCSAKQMTLNQVSPSTVVAADDKQLNGRTAELTNNLDVLTAMEVAENTKMLVREELLDGDGDGLKNKGGRNRHKNNIKMSKYDNCLRHFKYSKALDVVLKQHIAVKSPEITLSLLQELIRRSSLVTAISGRNQKELKPLVDFLCRHIRDVRYTSTLLDVAGILIDALNHGDVVIGDRLFKQLSNKINHELVYLGSMISLQGELQMLTCSKNIRTQFCC